MYIQTTFYKEQEPIKVDHDTDTAVIELTVRNTMFISLSKSEALKLAADIYAETEKI